MSVLSIADFGNRGAIIEIECSLSNNLPTIVIVGTANKTVDEAKERVRAAFTACSLQLPRKRITINLAPADLPKTDSSLDLAMAAAILQASGQIKDGYLSDTGVIGELGLDGSIRPTRGIVGKLLCGRKLGIRNYIIPIANLDQARLVSDVRLIATNNLRHLYTYLTTGEGLETLETGDGTAPHASKQAISDVVSLHDISGQDFAKRGLEIAAAGGHNIFFSGPPGTGKTMLAKALASLLPEMSHEEILEVTHLHSLCTNNLENPVMHRPFRGPHHSASLAAIMGGGHNLRPGEISLAHQGVLFLDEMPEFSRLTLEALRQPLEDRSVTVARAKDTVEYPANFILVATANPCPCGFYGSTKSCTCLPNQIARYQQRISGPILDRIDLHCTVTDIDHATLLDDRGISAKDVQPSKRISKARRRQYQRFDSNSKINALMTNRDVKHYAQLAVDAKDLLNQAAGRLNLSARSYMKTIKVARTIADLADSDTIVASHVAEALQYRPSSLTMNL